MALHAPLTMHSSAHTPSPLPSSFHGTCQWSGSNGNVPATPTTLPEQSAPLLHGTHCGPLLSAERGKVPGRRFVHAQVLSHARLPRLPLRHRPSALMLLLSPDTFSADGDPVPPPFDGNKGTCVVDSVNVSSFPVMSFRSSGRAVSSRSEHHVNPSGVRAMDTSCGAVTLGLSNFSKAVSGARVRRLAYGTREQLV